MFLGSGLAQTGDDRLLLGSLLSLCGLAWEIWGCVNYMRWKGHSGWFGLFGYLLLPGILILVFFPNLRQRQARSRRPDEPDESDYLAKRDGLPSYRYLPALAPVGVIAVLFGMFMSSVGSAIDPAEWQEVVQREVGFQVSMPGTPRIVQDIKETPAGNVELHKFIVEPKGKKELFMVVSVRFPVDLTKEFGDEAKILDIGRQDLLAAIQGQTKSERQIDINGHPALEMEVLPPKGAIVKARILATKNQVFEVWAGVPVVRLTSPDVRTFLESFQLLPANEAAPPKQNEQSTK
jgi:hypothetical protein